MTTPSSAPWGDEIYELFKAYQIAFYTEKELPALRAQLHTVHAPLFTVIKVAAEELPRVLPARDGAYLTHRLRTALLGAAAAEA